jgi:hypothetical protein
MLFIIIIPWADAAALENWQDFLPLSYHYYIS